MFILSDVTLPSSDSNSTPVNLGNRRDVAEHKIMALESLLAQLIFNPDLYSDQNDQDPNHEGIQIFIPMGPNGEEGFMVTAEANKVRELLQQERANSALEGEDPIDDVTSRIQEIKSKIHEAMNRIKILQALLKDLALNPDTQVDVDGNLPGTQVHIGFGGGTDANGNISTDFNVVKYILEATKAYLRELKKSKQFWKKLGHGNTVNQRNENNLDGYYFKSKSYLSGDINRDGLVDWFDTVFLRAILKGRVNLEEHAKKLGLDQEAVKALKKAIDVNGDGKFDDDDIKTMKRKLLPPVIADKIPEPGDNYRGHHKNIAKNLKFFYSDINKGFKTNTT